MMLNYSKDHLDNQALADALAAFDIKNCPNKGTDWSFTLLVRAHGVYAGDEYKVLRDLWYAAETVRVFEQETTEDSYNIENAPKRIQKNQATNKGAKKKEEKEEYKQLAIKNYRKTKKLNETALEKLTSCSEQ
jgi:hypothetical protein